LETRFHESEIPFKFKPLEMGLEPNDREKAKFSKRENIKPIQESGQLNLFIKALITNEADVDFDIYLWMVIQKKMMIPHFNIDGKTFVHGRSLTYS
jgi:hypothetical protein